MFREEPVAIIAAIMAVVSAGITFGYLNWSDAQVDAFQSMLVAVIPAVVIIGGAIAQRYSVYSPATVEKDFMSREDVATDYVQVNGARDG